MPIRKFYRDTRKKSRIKKIVLLAILVSAFLLIVMILAGFSLFVYYSKDLPRPESFQEKSIVQSTKIYDRTGKNILYELYGEEKREIIPLSQMPDLLQKALISVEDAKFYSHKGLDYQAIVRAILTDIKIGKPAFGASTISQQLVRSALLTREKSIKRKIQEMILTLELERKYSKNQILEWYFNQVPFGPNIYGVQTAARSYFNKDAKDLDLAESAALVAMVQSPSYYSPYGQHKDELLARKDYVLTRMAQENYITKDQAETTQKEILKFSDTPQTIKAPHFVFYVQDYLFEKYGKDALETQGYKVYTTLDWDMQQQAEKIVKDGVQANKSSRAYNASLVAIDPKTGEILAMVGSADWFGKSYPENCVSGKTCLFDPKVNVATYRIGRQPGSSMKPIVYATAFQKGYNDKTTVVDELTDFGIWGGKNYIPQNYDGQFRGTVTLREALAQSLNVPSVKVFLEMAGIQNSIANAKKMGITTFDKPISEFGPSLVLGGGEVKLLDLASAYGVFATEGKKNPATPILRIEDAGGNVIEENKVASRKVLEPDVCRLISDILSDNEARTPIFGSRSSLYFENYQVAVKTGTTSDYRDGWTLGYTPSIVVGVWAGNNDNEPINRKSGAMIASPMWHQFMNYVLAKYPKEYFTKPSGSGQEGQPTM